MKKIIGVICGLVAAYLFVLAVFSVVPNDGARAIGYNVGTHLPWIVLAGISYLLIRK